MSRRVVFGTGHATKLNVAGLVLTAAGMLLEIAAGSDLYPTFAGPTVLVATAVIVAFWSGRRWAVAGGVGMLLGRTVHGATEVADQ